MTKYQSLQYLKDNFQNFYWTKSEDYDGAIQLGSSDNSHITFEYKENGDFFFVHRTIFKEFNESTLMSHLSYSSLFKEYQLIKELTLIIKNLLNDSHFSNSSINETILYINNNFSS